MRMQMLNQIVPALLLFVPMTHADESATPAAPQSPVAPEASLQHFVVHPECRIELVAAEPDVMSPIQIAFDADGRMWVMEYSDYPNGPSEGEPGRSRIRILSDDNGDGRYENPRTFVDKLLFATGLAFWRDGVIVTSQGSVDFLRDTDGDLVCDDRQTWFRGFSAENPQLRANAPTFAIDGHFYVASGLRGGTVAAARDDWAQGAKPVDLSSRDFRFDPLTGACEAVTGPSQFGIAIDDWGNRFTCDNRRPCTQVVIEDRYAQRNPKLAIAAAVHNVARSGEQSRVFPISKFWTTSNLHEGQFTAACGICNFRGTALPLQFYGQHFVCDPTGNFVHCELLTPNGASFTSRPERDGVEFLASTDTWFRPVNLTNGPDGALYVVDMYRAVIEHPEWMPAELKNRPDLLLGVDRGRIYRVVHKDAPTGRPVLFPSMRSHGPRGLVTLLSDPESWKRDTAQRLLFERLSVDPNAVVLFALREAVTRAPLPHGRVRALWLLHRLGKVDAALLDAAFRAPHPRIIDQAVRIAEEVDPTPQRARQIAEIAAATDDGRLAFQCVLSLSAFPWQDDVYPALARAVCRHVEDSWMRTAAALAARDSAAQLLTAALELANHDPRIAPLVRVLAEQIGAAGHADVIGALLQYNSRTRNVLWGEMILGLAAGAARGGRGWRGLHDVLPATSRTLCSMIFADAAYRAATGGPDVEQAIALLELAPWDVAGEPLLALARGENLAWRVAAINALAGRNAPEIDAFLLDGFAGQTPAAKPALLSAVFASPARINKLLDEIEAGNVAPRELDVTRTGQLLKHADPTIRQRSQQLLAVNVNSDRQQVYNEYVAALALDADPTRGREVFSRTCIQCHRIGSLGVNVAPEISDVGRTQSREQILLSILDPNRAIDNNYFSYSVLEKSGTVHTGIIAAETATSVTLKQAEGKQVTILRSDIEELKSNGISLMPVGVEKDINLQQMADLISFIKNWRYLDGSVPGVGGP